MLKLCRCLQDFMTNFTKKDFMTKNILWCLHKKKISVLKVLSTDFLFSMCRAHMIIFLDENLQAPNFWASLMSQNVIFYEFVGHEGVGTPRSYHLFLVKESSYKPVKENYSRQAKHRQKPRWVPYWTSITCRPEEAHEWPNHHETTKATHGIWACTTSKKTMDFIATSPPDQGQIGSFALSYRTVEHRPCRQD